MNQRFQHILYDRKDISFHEENKYYLFKDRFEYIVRVHYIKNNVSLVSVGQMKILLNASKCFFLMVIKPKEKDVYDALASCDPIHKHKLFDIVSDYNEVF